MAQTINPRIRDQKGRHDKTDDGERKNKILASSGKCGGTERRAKSAGQRQESGCGADAKTVRQQDAVHRKKISFKIFVAGSRSSKTLLQGISPLCFGGDVETSAPDESNVAKTCWPDK